MDQTLVERVIKWGPILVPALSILGLPGLRTISKSRITSEEEARAVARRVGLYLGLASPSTGIATAYALSVVSRLLGHPELTAWIEPALILTPPTMLCLSYVPGRSDSMAKTLLVSSLTTSIPATTTVWYVLS